MGKFVIAIISNTILITGDALTDTVIFAIICIIAFLASYAVVGVILPGKGISKLKSVLHWLIRISLILVLWFLARQYIILKTWFITYPSSTLIVLSILILLASISVAIYIFVHLRRGRHNSIISNSIESEPEMKPVKSETRQPIAVPICKKCGSIMVVKHGKHGEFLGCTKFPNCWYSESIKH